MAKLIDLSLRIEDGMQVHPDDPDVRLVQDKFLKTDGYVNHVLRAGLHAGTHMDTPMHGIESNYTVSDLPLERFTGPGKIIDATGLSFIDIDVVKNIHIVPDDIIFLYTGHIKKYGQSNYYRVYPVISESLAKYFIQKKVKMIGIDGPSIDGYPHQLHRILFENNINILENLSNLDELIEYDSFTIYAFPLKIKAEASLMRVVAEIK